MKCVVSFRSNLTWKQIILNLIPVTNLQNFPPKTRDLETTDRNLYNELLAFSSYFLVVIYCIASKLLLRPLFLYISFPSLF